jgi:thiamine-phosphate diphosphorylase
VPAGFVIGVSVGSDAEATGARGADYAGIGPLYGSASKLDAGTAIGIDGFQRLAAAAGLPAVAIGGISVATAGAAIAAGAAGIAVIAAVFGRDDPERAARELRREIDAALAGRPPLSHPMPPPAATTR